MLLITKYSERNLHLLAYIYYTYKLRQYVVISSPMTTSDYTLDMQMSAENQMTSSQGDVIYVLSPQPLVFMCSHL